MKLRVPIEEAREGDRINGKKVVEVLHRLHARYVRLILEGGRDIVDGYMGRDTVEIERP
ncbi:MAG: hypothetical protein HPY58_14185 [Firmicutes bacterium]|nr:hypothetical protein [Bacillota bacterium]NPV30761.1 hypothetical protein [Bacillota bacterium]